MVATVAEDSSFWYCILVAQVFLSALMVLPVVWKTQLAASVPLTEPLMAPEVPTVAAAEACTATEVYLEPPKPEALLSFAVVEKSATAGAVVAEKAVRASVWPWDASEMVRTTLVQYQRAVACWKQVAASVSVALARSAAILYPCTMRTVSLAVLTEGVIVTEEEVIVVEVGPVVTLLASEAARAIWQLRY